MWIRHSLFWLFVSTLGCSSASSTVITSPAPASKPGPATTPSESPPISESSRSWTITPTSQPQRYTSTATVNLELVSDSGTVQDQITERTTFTLLTASASGSTSFLGAIDTHTIETGSRISLSESQSVFPLSFTGHIVDGDVILDALNGQPTPAGVQCTNSSLSTLATVQRNITILPPQLISGLMWTDSIKTTGCTGAVPLIILSIRSYEVLGETAHAGQRAILLKRTDKTISTGEGSENQHRILIRGQGNGAARVYLDPETGALIESEGEMRTNLIVTMGRSRQFTQIVRDRTTIIR